MWREALVAACLATMAIAGGAVAATPDHIAPASGELQPGKYRLKIRSTDSQGHSPEACYIDVDDEVQITPGNKLSVRYLGRIRAEVTGREALLEFSLARYSAEATFTLRGAPEDQGYKGALVTSSFYCNGSGTWSLVRLDRAPAPAVQLADQSPPIIPARAEPAKSTESPKPADVAARTEHLTDAIAGIAPVPASGLDLGGATLRVSAPSTTEPAKGRDGDKPVEPGKGESTPAQVVASLASSVPAPAQVATAPASSGPPTTQVAPSPASSGPTPPRPSEAVVPPPSLPAGLTFDNSDAANRIRLLEERLARLTREEETRAAQQAAQPRVAQFKTKAAHALVIGNSKYKGAPLPNAANDARAVSARLSSFGIDVRTVIDADRLRMVNELAAFGEKVRDADLAIVFYAGHAIQVNGTNYILPTDLDMNGAPTGITLQAISLSTILEGHLSARVKLIFLDACRDNPLARLAAATRGISLGLAPVDVAAGTLISYATKDGSFAADGTGPNSPYTSALLEFLSEPEDISLILRKVRQRVMSATGGRQQPWEYGSLVGDRLILSSVAR